MKQILFLSLIFISLIMILGISGCQSSYANNATPNQTNQIIQNETQQQNQLPPNTVEIKNFAFNPSTITVSRGAKVTWINNDTYVHTVTFDQHVYLINSQVQPGQELINYFDIPGTYTYHCSIHPSMTGTIIVQ